MDPRQSERGRLAAAAKTPSGTETGRLRSMEDTPSLQRIKDIIGCAPPWFIRRFSRVVRAAQGACLARSRAGGLAVPDVPADAHLRRTRARTRVPVPDVPRARGARLHPRAVCDVPASWHPGSRGAVDARSIALAIREADDGGGVERGRRSVDPIHRSRSRSRSADLDPPSRRGRGRYRCHARASRHQSTSRVV